MSVLAPPTSDCPGLTDLFGASAGAYAAAEPFPHAVFTGLFDRDVLRACAREFPPIEEMTIQFDRVREVKSAEQRWDRFGPATRSVVAELQSKPFLDALEALTGFRGLISDPELWGGGQHQIRTGGVLGVHADFNQHPSYPMRRRLNVLLYLNEDWSSGWGGQLELWDRDMRSAVKVIEPEMNTLVIFTTTSTSYHGHPDPLRCPPDRTRRSLAFYYYTIGATEDERHGTLFQERPGETSSPPPSRARISTDHLRSAVAPWVPEAVRRWRRARRAPHL